MSVDPFVLCLISTSPVSSHLLIVEADELSLGEKFSKFELGNVACALLHNLPGKLEQSGHLREFEIEQFFEKFPGHIVNIGAICTVITMDFTSASSMLSLHHLSKSSMVVFLFGLSTTTAATLSSL